MITRCMCALNGQGLQDIDPTIIVTDIQESAPLPAFSTAANARRDGTRILRTRRQSLSVRITFEIHEYDPARRKPVAVRACDWAREGFLTIGDRPGQRLYAVCDSLPVIPSALRWTDRLTVGFTAFALPYWQDVSPTQAAFHGTAGKAVLIPGGTAPCLLEAEIEAEGPVNALTVAVNGGMFRFTGLGMQTGEKLEIGYEDKTQRQFMKIGSRSALVCRTADSADDLTLLPRTRNEIAVTADGPVNARFFGRGLYR